MKSRGFSLLEILIVLAIIAVLVVLVVAGFRQAMGARDSTVCLSNLREYGMGFGRRITETGSLHPYRYWEDGIGKETWRADLAINEWLPWNVALDTCPAEPVPMNNRVNNGHVSHYGAPARGDPASGFVSVSKVAEPSKLVMVADVVPVWYFTDTEAYITFRHGGKVNLLFLDGHTESRTHGQIPWREERWKTPRYHAFWHGVE